MSYKLEFELEGLPKLPNQLLGARWQARSAHKKTWGVRITGVTMYRLPRAPLKKAKVSYIRYSSAEPDHDGLVGSFKAVQDALVNSKILQDDKTENIGQPSYQWIKCKPKQGKIRVTIEEITDV